MEWASKQLGGRLGWVPSYRAFESATPTVRTASDCQSDLLVDTQADGFGTGV